ncbi:MAG: stage V sporulation protein AD, partial [Clostridia bacterium]|nr:stage V sporulation protein AD [Clostridia bacterium]
WTVTGAGCAITEAGDGAMYIKEVMPGRIVDFGISDASNMGAAMAPAAADTLSRYFDESGKKPGDFDVILTGDLGGEGHSLTVELADRAGYRLGAEYLDCGMLLYKSSQDVHSGGSGCGCSALGLAVYLYERFRKKEIRDALFVGTGALMSPMTVAQGHSIPGIAHLIRFSSEV